MQRPDQSYEYMKGFNDALNFLVSIVNKNPNIKGFEITKMIDIALDKMRKGELHE
jgi:hypothetical protein